MTSAEVFFGKQFKKLDDVVKENPDCITINGLVSSRYVDERGNSIVTPCYTFEEDFSACFKADTTALKPKLENLLAHCGGDENLVNEYLRENPISVQIFKDKASNGKEFWNIRPAKVNSQE